MSTATLIVSFVPRCTAVVALQRVCAVLSHQRTAVQALEMGRRPSGALQATVEVVVESEHGFEQLVRRVARDWCVEDVGHQAAVTI
jgi:acetolactate synthase regulatory subunit